MKWIIIIETILLIGAIYKIYDLYLALRAMILMWEDEQNRTWLKALEDTGAEIIEVRGVKR